MVRQGPSRNPRLFSSVGRCRLVPTQDSVLHKVRAQLRTGQRVGGPEGVVGGLQVLQEALMCRVHHIVVQAVVKHRPAVNVQTLLGFGFHVPPDPLHMLDVAEAALVEVRGVRVWPVVGVVQHLLLSPGPCPAVEEVRPALVVGLALHRYLVMGEFGHQVLILLPVVLLLPVLVPPGPLDAGVLQPDPVEAVEALRALPLSRAGT
mmetsp:Transcript_46414/g.104305  ORF Transcript_46414/g.104305 Transcript_46414/m.104305 type:complete len:205 (+) Transcript_46414:114-728(+)